MHSTENLDHFSKTNLGNNFSNVKAFVLYLDTLVEMEQNVKRIKLQFHSSGWNLWLKHRCYEVLKLGNFEMEIL